MVRLAARQANLRSWGDTHSGSPELEAVLVTVAGDTEATDPNGVNFLEGPSVVMDGGDRPVYQTF